MSYTICNNLIIYLKDKLIDIPEITDPGAGEVEEGYQDELAEEKEVDSSVLGAEELDSEEVLGGGEGELGGDVADDHPGSPASVGQYRKARIPNLYLVGKTSSRNTAVTMAIKVFT